MWQEANTIRRYSRCANAVIMEVDPSVKQSMGHSFLNRKEANIMGRALIRGVSQKGCELNMPERDMGHP
jgi:hypothetical protein